MRSTQNEFSVWTYIAVILLIYGVLLTAGGAYQFAHPPDTVLARFHATLIAGILLAVIGGSFLCWKRWRTNLK